MITLNSRVKCQTMFPAFKSPNLQVSLLTYNFVNVDMDPVQRFPKKQKKTLNKPKRKKKIQDKPLYSVIEGLY